MKTMDNFELILDNIPEKLLESAGSVDPTEVKNEEDENKEGQVEFNNDTPDAPDDTTPPEDDGLLQTAFDYLKENGLIIVPEDYEFSGDMDDVYKRDYEARHAAVFQNVIESLPENVRTVVEYGLQGGSDLSQFITNTVKTDDYSSVEFTDDENLGKAEKFLSEYYANKGLDSNLVGRLIQGHKDDAELLKVAESRRQEYVTTQKENQKAEMQRLKEQKLEQERAQQDYVNSIDIYLENQEWQPKTKEVVKNHIYSNGVHNTLDYVLRSDPQSFVQLAAFVATYQKDAGFSAFGDKAVRAKEARKIKKSFMDAWSTQKKRPKTNTSTTTTKPIIPQGVIDFNVNNGN